MTESLFWKKNGIPYSRNEIAWFSFVNSFYASLFIQTNAQSPKQCLIVHLFLLLKCQCRLSLFFWNVFRFCSELITFRGFGLIRNSKTTNSVIWFTVRPPKGFFFEKKNIHEIESHRSLSDRITSVSFRFSIKYFFQSKLSEWMWLKCCWRSNSVIEMITFFF